VAPQGGLMRRVKRDQSTAPGGRLAQLSEGAGHRGPGPEEART